VDKQSHRIFKKGSRTYFYSSLFFPPAVKNDVFTLYAFVRTADDLVDSVPQDADGFYSFIKKYRMSMAGTNSNDPIIDNYIRLAKRRKFDPAWTEAFFYSMEMDLHKSRYNSIEETLEYIYGSAEVIGLFMTRIMNLANESHHAACMLGRAMQYINFIRDINEDIGLGRRYLPTGGFALSDISESAARENPVEFGRFIREQIVLYRAWQAEAERGFYLLPKRVRIPVRAASQMYKWTSSVIAGDPMIVFRKKVKPSVWRVVASVLAGLLA
jgi:phytoene synthase